MSGDKHIQTILDRDGQVLHEGLASTLKAFVAALVRDGKSLARADLRRRDLSGLALSQVDFTGALLDGADLRGMVAHHGKFAGASLRGASAQGMLAEHSQFQDADLSVHPEYGATHFEGARLTFGNFSGAVLDGATFDGAAMSRTVLFHVFATKTSFRSARLHDAEFSFGTFIDCNWEDAKIISSTHIDAVHLPDRTAWTTVLNGRFRGAEIDQTVPAFKHDRVWSRALKGLAYTSSSAAIFGGAHHLGDDGSLLSNLLSGGTTVVLATTAALVVKEMLAEQMRDYVEHHLARFHKSIRTVCWKAERAGANMKEFTAAAVHGPGAMAVWNALNATKDDCSDQGIFSAFWRLESGGPTTLIFADRRHLALALETLCAGAVRHRMHGDLVLIRNDAEEPAAPTLIRYRADGGTSLAWTHKGKVTASADYNVKGELIRASEGFSPAGQIDEHVLAFEQELLREHGVALDYDRKTHEIRAGQDGSILVMSRMTRRLGNPHDVAMVEPDGKRVKFRNGKPLNQPRQTHEAPEVAQEVQLEPSSLHTMTA